MPLLAQSEKQGALTTLLLLGKAFLAIAFRKVGRILHLKSLLHTNWMAFGLFRLLWAFYYKEMLPLKVIKIHTKEFECDMI